MVLQIFRRQLFRFGSITKVRRLVIRYTVDMTIDWDQIYKNGTDGRVMNQLLLSQILAQGVSGEGEVLDIGCGTGDLAVKLARRGYDVTGIDRSEVAIQRARERSEAAKTTEKTAFRVLNLDDPGEAAELHNNRYQIIFCKDTLAFIDNRANLLSWAKDHLAEDGRFVLMTPVLRSGREYDEKMRNMSIYTEALDRMLRQHFNQITQVYCEYFDEWGEERVLLMR